MKEPKTLDTAEPGTYIYKRKIQDLEMTRRFTTVL